MMETELVSTICNLTLTWPITWESFINIYSPWLAFINAFTRAQTGQYWYHTMNSMEQSSIWEVESVQVLKKDFSTSMEPKCHLLYSQKPAICPSPKPDESTPSTLFLKDQFKYYSSMCRPYKWLFPFRFTDQEPACLNLRNHTL
jgi:hypothetical protein